VVVELALVDWKQKAQPLERPAQGRRASAFLGIPDGAVDIERLQPGMTQLDPRQTGFCVKNIVADDGNDRIECDVFTNYYGGDVDEILDLRPRENSPVYLGQGCAVLPGAGIRVHAGAAGHHVHLDSGVEVLSGGYLEFDGAAGDLVVHLEHDITVRSGGRLTAGIGVYFTGPGTVRGEGEIKLGGAVFLAGDEGPLDVIPAAQRGDLI